MTPRIARIRTWSRLTAIVLAVLLLRLADLQLRRGAEFRGRADHGFTEEAVPPLRGALLDRNGVVLAQSEPVFTLEVRPLAFRDRNVLDALGDLAAAAGLRRGEGDASSPPAGPEARLRERGDLRADAAALVRPLLAAPAARILGGGGAAASRLGRRNGAQGGLFWPPGELETRILDAAGVLGGATGRDVARRAGEAGASALDTTLGALLGVDAESVLERIEAEERDLSEAAARLGFDDAGDFLLRLFELERIEAEHIDALVERRIDEEIVFREHGVYAITPAAVGFQTWSGLTGEAAVPLDAAEDFDAALYLRHRWLSGSGQATAAARAEFVRGLRSLPCRRETADRRIAARRLGLLAADPDLLLRHAAGGRRGRASRLALSPVKEARLRLERRADRSLDVGEGGDFRLPCLVHRQDGLHRLGFSVRTDAGRILAGDLPGSLAALLGVPARSGEPLGGIELALARDASGDGARFRGRPGRVRRPVRSAGPPEVVEPVADGGDVRLTLDANLTARIEPLVDRCGAVAVLDIATGGLLALVTNPSAAAPDLVTEERRLLLLSADAERADMARARGVEDGPTAAEARALLREALRNSPAVHRAVTGPGQMPPGSVVKVCVAAAAVEEGLVDPDTTIVRCVPRGTRFFNDGHHGSVGLHAAIARSCNAFFWDTASRLGTERLLAWYERFGLFRDIPFLPAGGEARLRLIGPGEDPRNLGIGQGSLSVPPAQIAAAVAIFGRDGVDIPPHVVTSIGGSPPAAAGSPMRIVSPATSRRILDAMRDVARTGTAVGVPGLVELDVAGKTGTAQWTLDPSSEDGYFAWFAGVAPATKPRIAVAVMLERADLSGREAARIAADVIRTCLDVLGT